MSLEDLVKHIPAQTSAIYSTFPSSSPHSEVPWKMGLESLERKELVKKDPTDDVHPDRFPLFCFTVKPPQTLSKLWRLSSRRILVRPEYYETEQAILTANEDGKDVFVVAGQPGIGKSVSLLLLLLRRIALGLPTILQIHKDWAILFHEGGISELNLRDPAAYDALVFPYDSCHKRIWAIIVTGPLLPEPARIFKQPGIFFVVTATSCLDYPKWITYAAYREFIMKPWSSLEMIQVQPLIGNRRTRKERRLWNVLNKFGASPGDLAKYAADPTVYERLLVDQITKVNPADLRYISRVSDSTYHHIFTLWPSLTRREVFEKRIASQYALELLWERHLQHRVSDAKYFYDMYRASVTTAADAEWILRSRIHQLLRSQLTIRLSPIVRDAFDPTDFIGCFLERTPMDLQLPNSHERTLVEGGEFHMNCYYRLGSADFPGIDSLLPICPPDGSPPVLLMFRITSGTVTYDMIEEGFRKIDNLGLSPNIRKYYVVVTPESVNPRMRVSGEYSREGWGKVLGKVSRVFNYPVPADVLFPENESHDA